MSLWASRTDWFTPRWTVDLIATFLGVAANTISQLLTRGSFPQPSDRDGRRHLWEPAAVYRYALQHRPQLAARVPRLFPRVPDPTAAVFAGRARSRYRAADRNSLSIGGFRVTTPAARSRWLTPSPMPKAAAPYRNSCTDSSAR
jgi:hypothetical protein